MEGLPRYLSSLAFFYLHVISIEGQKLDAEGLRNLTMTELKDFVRAVETNSRNCSALTGCSSSCSRLSCYEYGEVGDQNYECVNVFNNTALCEQTCSWRNFDYSRGFVRVLDRDDNHISETVCTQRTLDDLFKSSSMNNSSRFFRVFFGAVDGTTRIYPGADENCKVVPPYDPWARPWYIKSTTVPKCVSVLIDSGFSNMISPPITNSSDTYLDKAVDTATRFLDTIEDGVDYVTISRFVGNGTLILANVSSTMYTIANDYQPLNGFLNASRYSKYNVSKSSSAFDISNAINSSIRQLSSSSCPDEYLKVVIVLTGTLSLDDISSNLSIPTDSGVNVFVYNFNSLGSQQAVCKSSIRAFIGPIEYPRIDDPFYALESYYSFLARVRRNFYVDLIDYSGPYPDFSQVDNNTLTLSKAAFDPIGDSLLGVVGIDIFENKLNEQFQPDDITFGMIATVIQHKRNDTIFNASNDNTSVCFNPYDLALDCQINVSSNVKKYLCGKKASTGKNVGCCVTNCMSSKSKGAELPKILGGVAGGILGLLVIAAITWRCIALRTEDKRVLAESPQFTFPGPKNEAVLEGDTKRTLD